MIDASKILTFHMIWLRPFQGWFVICGLSTCLLNLKFLSPHTTKIWKAIQNVENGVVCG